MSFAADDYEAIRRRAEEIKAERNLALTGSALLEEPKAVESATDWPAPGAPYFTHQNDADGMTPSMWNDAFRQFIIEGSFNVVEWRLRE
jgi:hypothetical protein